MLQLNKKLLLMPVLCKIKVKSKKSYSKNRKLIVKVVKVSVYECAGYVSEGLRPGKLTQYGLDPF